MTMQVGGTSGLTFPDASVQNTAATGFGFKNRIINGAMMIDQRNAGASVTVNSGANFYGVDRFVCTGEATDGVFAVQRSATAPAGFINSLGAVVTTADASIGSAQRYLIQQRIEGFNVADFGWGAAGAATVTLSFLARSSVTGTFGGSLRNAAGDRSYPFSYSISSANTWEQKSITITGDTTGTWATDNTAGIYVTWSLGAGSSLKSTAGAWSAGSYWAATGSVDLISTNAATFYITGVQLEKGSTATSFDYRPYGTELVLCQRYCLVDTNAGGTYRHFAVGYCSNSTLATFDRYFPVIMRTSPSATISSGTAFIVDCPTGQNTLTVTDIGYNTPSVARLQATVASGLTAGWGAMLASDGSTSLRSITYSAEL